MKKYYIHTLGCAMNQADSEKINMILLQAGFFKVSDWRDADLILLNTCSVRQKGEDKVFGFIHDLRKFEKINNKNFIVGLTGCMVRKTGVSDKYLVDYIRNRRSSKNISYLDNDSGFLNNDSGFLNNDDKLFPRFGSKLDFLFRIEDIKYLTKILSHIYGEEIGSDYAFDDYLKQKQFRENKSLATVIIQTGCDNFCTYCIVPYTRGKEKSRSIEDIIEEVKQVVLDGAKEITLVGQNVNSYGKQWIDRKYWNEEKSSWNKGLSKSPFRQLLEEVNKIDGLVRIRFTSSNPHDMTQDILDAHFELDKMCNYLHFALQSGSDKILTKMNRRHNYLDFKKMVDYLRSRDPLFSISTDIIVGFSGETEDDFNLTKNAFVECKFDFAYNARYSIRTGTIAAKIYPDDISTDIKSQRWHTLNNQLLSNIEERNKLMIGREEQILIYGIKGDEFYGRTRNFKEVYFSVNDSYHIGDFALVKITHGDRFILRGEIIIN